MSFTHGHVAATRLVFRPRPTQLAISGALFDQCTAGPLLLLGKAHLQLESHPPETSMQLLDLNLDILTAIASHLATDDIVPWRQSCRTIAVTAEAFRYPRVVLSKSADIKRACAFFAAHPKYARNVQDLRIEDEDDMDAADVVSSEDVANNDADDDRDMIATLKHRRLAPVLGLLEVSNLRALYLDSAEDVLRDFGPAWQAALLRHTGLEVITFAEQTGRFDGLSSSTWTFFKALRAPLRELELSPLLGEGHTHLFKLLANFTDTLEALSAQIVDIAPWRGPPLVFPRVHRLKLEYATLHIPTVEAAFPNVRWLRVDHDLQYEDIDGDWGYRARNAAQGCTVWRRIPHLEGDVGGLWSIQLSGVEVELLQVDDILNDCEDVRCLLDVLGSRGIQPEMLALCLRAQDPIDGILEALPALLPLLDILHIEVYGNRPLHLLHAPEELPAVRVQAVTAFLVRLSKDTWPSPLTSTTALTC
jgi:hypothetical protein